MKVVLFGASGHARVTADALERGGYQIAGLVASDLPAGTIRFGYRVLGSEFDLPRVIEEFRIEAGVVAVGDNWSRSQFVERIKTNAPDLRFISAVHPSAHIGRDVSIGDGTIIMAGAIVNAGSQIGPFSLVNTKASLDHDGCMGAFSSLAPGATVGGNVTIGNHSAVSLGASIIHQVRIGSHSLIGAGAVVIRDIPDGVLALGVPAKVVRRREPSERYL